MSDRLGEIRVRLPPPSFNVPCELHDCANPARRKARGRNWFEKNAQERVRCVLQRCLCRDPPLLSVKLPNPVGVQITTARVESSPIVRFDVHITIGNPVSWVSPNRHGIKVGEKFVRLRWMRGMVVVWVAWFGSISALFSKQLSRVERIQNLVKVVG